MTKLKNGMVLAIRKAIKEDAQAVLDYLNQIGGESDNLLFGLNGFPLSQESEAMFIDSLQASKTSGLFIGLVEEEIVSVVSLQSPPRERIAHQADLAMSVKKKFWHLGIATAMLRHVIDFARQSGQLEVLHLGVRADNTRALSLYRRVGFAEIGRYPKFFKIKGIYYDEILMNLYLNQPRPVGILIRPMFQSDIDAILSAFKAQGWEKPRSVLEEYYEKAEKDELSVFVAQKQDHIAGYCILYPKARSGPFKGIPEIADFNVFEPHRRQGIGTALIDAAENAARLVSPTVTLGVGLHAGYGDAQRMYVKRGYIPDGSGLWYQDKPLKPHASCQNDDDLVLYLSKKL